MTNFFDGFDFSKFDWSTSKYRNEKTTRFWEDLMAHRSHIEIDINYPPKWDSYIRWTYTNENGDSESFYSECIANDITPLCILYKYKKYDTVKFFLNSEEYIIPPNSGLTTDVYPKYSECELRGIIKESLRLHWKDRVEINFEHRIF